MGCCGQPVSAPDTQYANRSQPLSPGIISHQPGPHPGPQSQAQSRREKPPLLVSGPSPPPQSLQQNNQPVNGSNWLHTPSPPPPSAYSTPLSPNLNHFAGAPLTPPPATYIPSGPSSSAFFSPLSHPGPVHAPPRSSTVSPSISTTIVHTLPALNAPVPSNEGKMSISIDFGEYSRYFGRSKLNLYSLESRYHFFWCSELQ